MFESLKNLVNPQVSPSEEASPMQTRLMEVVNQYSSAVPITLRPMLNSLLHGLQDKMTDEKIIEFLHGTRGLLDYVQHGGDIPFTDGDEG